MSQEPLIGSKLYGGSVAIAGPVNIFNARWTEFWIVLPLLFILPFKTM